MALISALVLDGMETVICATFHKRVALWWFDMAGWLAYVGCFFFGGGRFNIYILHSDGSCSPFGGGMF